MMECTNCKKMIYGDREKCPHCDMILDRTQKVLLMEQKKVALEKERTRLLINELTFDLFGGIMAGMGVAGFITSLQPKVRLATALNSVVGGLGGPDDRLFSFVNICMEYKVFLVVIGLVFMMISSYYKNKRKEI